MDAGARIGRYEILSVLGRGGMGEVYRARDTRLGRDVAIKALPEQFAHDPERLARLEREAKLLAALSHANVATILGIEEQDGTAFLVLELVEGVTLADRIRMGRFRLEHALEIAVQIAAALEAAHDADVVHRDLKPANVNVTPDGRVKVLDFGLAKTLSPNRSALETRTVRCDEPDVGIGSAAYMSPEQARGEETGAQTDIWSLGVVLYEMLTGGSPFARVTTTETLARVLEAEPDFARLPAATPSTVRRLLRRCLEKDRRRRFRDVGDVKLELEDALAALAAGVPAAAVAPSLARRVGVVAAALAVVALATFGVWSLMRQTEVATPPQVVRFALPSTGEQFVAGWGLERVAVSPDGSRVAHAMDEMLRIRRLSGLESTELAIQALDPFFSPDGEWLGFFNNDALQKVPSDGGTPVVIAATTDRPAGATWGEDGTIVFATSTGLYRVSADGGDVERLVKPESARGELQYAWPHFLPGSSSVLFTIVPQGSIESAKIARLDLATRAIDVVLTGGTSARYLPTGRLLYVAAGELVATRFDLATGRANGEPVPIPGIRIATDSDNGAADFAVSKTGTLAYVEPRAATSAQSRLVWVDREGREEPLDIPPDRLVYARVSPDGTRIALDINRSNRDIWIWDIGRETLTRLTDGATEDMTPVWSPDGRRVYFASNRTGNFDLYWQPADGSTQAAVALVNAATEVPSSISPDGARVVVTKDFHDVGLVDLSTGDFKALLERDAQDWLGEVSPDGHWLAYESDESGAQFEIYLRSFPDTSGRREQISIDGGRHASWGPPGSNELYYVALDGSMMAVPIELSPELRIGRAVKLFDYDPPQRTISGRFYDVSPVDGRFLIKRPAAPRFAETETVHVVLNWFEELRALPP